jgi:hypothetical protein
LAELLGADKQEPNHLRRWLHVDNFTAAFSADKWTIVAFVGDIPGCVTQPGPERGVDTRSALGASCTLASPRADRNIAPTDS